MPTMLREEKNQDQKHKQDRALKKELMNKPKMESRLSYFWLQVELGSLL